MFRNFLLKDVKQGSTAEAFFRKTDDREPQTFGEFNNFCGRFKRCTESNLTVFVNEHEY